MNTIARLLIPLALLAGATFAAQAAIKCWTNHDGERECGDAVPPEYAQQETRTLNQRGITVEIRERSKSAAEREAESAHKSAEADGAAQARREQEARVKADRVLLATFASEDDIVMARDRKVTALEGTIEMTHLAIAKHQKRLGEYRQRIAQIERSGRAVPPDLAGDVAAEEQQLEKKFAFLAAREAEVAAVRAEYAGYLTRYRQLVEQPATP